MMMVRRSRRDNEKPGQAEIKISAEADAKSDLVTQFERCTSFNFKVLM